MKLPIDYTKLSQKQRWEVRTEYIKRQEGRCYFCGTLIHQPPSDAVTNKPINLKLFPPNFLKNPIHLQHCHETNMTEGAVHARCNAVLWQYYGR